MRGREPTALEHLERHPAGTLDRRSLEILAGELAADVATHSRALAALEQSSPDSDDLDQWRADVSVRQAALERVKKAIQ
jgi:hypothetical protein